MQHLVFSSLQPPFMYCWIHLGLLLALQRVVSALHLAVVTQDSGLPSDQGCLGSSLGTAGGYQVWALDETCATLDASATNFESGDGQRNILAVTHPALDNSVFGPTPSNAEWAAQVSASVQGALAKVQSDQTQNRHQRILQPQSLGARCLGQHEDLLLFSLDDELLSMADVLFPSHAQLTLLSNSTRPIRQSSEERLQKLLPLQYSPATDRILESLSVDQLRKDVRWLSGEDPQSPIYSRHSVTQGARDAANYILEHIDAAGGNCSLDYFQSGFAPNVVCHFAPTGPSPSQQAQEGAVLVSAHYDSRGTFGSVEAPGADDDGSGTAVLLSLARVLSERKVRFQHPVMLVAFAGEEQGLVGSRALAKSLRQSNTDLLFALQMDMLAYRAASEPLSMGMPDKIGSAVARELVWSAATMYTPQLRTGLTPACCSDHQSFHEAGFAATWVFERPGPIADPQYHQSGDRSDREGYDWEQMRAIGSVVLATLLHVAGGKAEY